MWCVKSLSISVRLGSVLVSGLSQGEAWIRETAPGLGQTALCADGEGGVKTAATGGTSCLVVDVDTTAKTVTILL